MRRRNATKKPFPGRGDERRQPHPHHHQAHHHHHPSSSSSSSSSSSFKGTTICIGRITEEKLSDWFAGKISKNKNRGGGGGGGYGVAQQQNRFNHEYAGMTNPSLQVSLSLDENENGASDDESDDQIITVCGLSKDESGPGGGEAGPGGWWPRKPKFEHNLWRILQYRERIGHGIECYEAVKDACLNWQFASPHRRVEEKDNDDDGPIPYTGIAPVKSPCRHVRPPRQVSTGAGYNILHNAAVDDDNPFESGSTECALKLGPGRRLATYTRMGGGGSGRGGVGVPRLLMYVVNPCQVVYDVVDQRGPSTTYTSTAYATMRGHWLRGEERVTVALRDDETVELEILSYSRPASSFAGRLVWPFIGSRQNAFLLEQMKALRDVGRRAPQTRGAVRHQRIDGMDPIPTR